MGTFSTSILISVLTISFQDEHFIYHSGYTKEQLMPGHEILMERLSDPYFTQYTVCKKYAEKKFLKAAVFALRWAKMHPSGCTN